MFIVILSAEHPKLAKAEVQSLFPFASFSKNLAFVSTSKHIPRLASAKAAYKLLFKTTVSNLNKSVAAYNWQQHYKKSFSVTYLDPKQRISKEKQLAAIIHSSLRNPNVSLTNPTTQFTFIQNKNTVYATIPLKIPNPNYATRFPHKQPGFKPISLKPRLARLLVNLTGSTTSIYDPMCGIGGFLIEAGLMKLDVKGNDINKHAITATKKNLAKYKIKATLTNADAFSLKRKHPYLITDIPYGRNTAPVSKEFINNVLNHIATTVTKRAVIILPSTAKYSLPKKLALEGNFTYYIHKSLSKRILIVRIK